MSPVCLPCATSKGQTTCITIPPPSLEGPGGAFDVPKAKCPPDRGSSDCVTGSPASSILSSFSASPSSSKFILGSSPPSSWQSFASHPKDIPSRSNSSSSVCSTPSLTPDGSISDNANSLSDSIQEKDALDFLMTIFPCHGLSALPHAQTVSISASSLGSAFNGVVLHLPNFLKTLYVDGKSAAAVSLRESIVALLDLASESLDCEALVIVLERSSPDLGPLLHSLMYVGGTVVTKPPFEVDPAFILVGLEL